MGYPVKQSQTAQPLVFLMIQSADHVTGATGLSPTVKLSKNGGAGAAPSGAVSEIDSTNLPGWYKVAGNATDSGTLGPLLLHAAAAGADPADDRFDVVAYDPQAAAGLGLTNLDAAVSTRMATYSQPSGFLAATFPTTLASPTNITAGTITTTTNLTNAPTSGDFTATMKTSLNAATPAVTISAGGLTATSIASAAITAAKIATDAIGAAQLAADAVVEIQSGLSTYAGGDTAGTTTLLSRLTSTRAGNLDNLDAAVSGVKTVTDRLGTMLVIVSAGPNYQFTTSALANGSGGGGGGTNDVYVAARIYGAVDPLDAEGRQVFRSPPNAGDGGGIAKVRLGPTNPRGGRIVELDPDA